MKFTTTEILQDNHLASVRLLLDPHQACRIFQQGLPMFYRNGSKLLSCEPKIKKYKSGKRLVVQYLLKVQSPEETIELLVLGKIYNSDRGSKIVRQLDSLQNYLKAQNEPIMIPKVYGYLPHVRLLLHEYIFGQSIREVLLSPAGQTRMKQTAKLLANFHEINIELPQNRTAQAELDQLNQLIIALPEQDVSLKNILLKKYHELETTSRKLMPDRFCLIHRDFYHDQVLFQNQRAILTDLDEMCLGEPALDIGNYLAHLRLLSLEMFHQSNHLEEYRQLFISEYQNNKNQQVEFERIIFYEIATYLRLACILTTQNKPKEWVHEMILLGSIK